MNVDELETWEEYQNREKTWWEYRMDEMHERGIISMRITTYMLHYICE